MEKISKRNLENEKVMKKESQREKKGRREV